MPRNNNLDPTHFQQIEQYFAVNPQAEFLPSLKNDLLKQHATRLPSRYKSQKICYALITAIMLVIIILFATPIGHTLAQNFVKLFSRTESDDIPYPQAMTAIAGYTQTAALPPENTPSIQVTKTPEATMTPDPRSITEANLTIDEIEHAAGFDVLVPSQVPSIFIFSGGYYLPEENMSRFFYGLRGFTSNGLQISQEPITEEDDCDLCSEIGPSGKIQTVQIGDVEGEFVRGVWKSDNGYRIWTNDPWLIRLRWQTNDTVFEIMFFGPPSTMHVEDMVHLAESMSTSNSPLSYYSNLPTSTLPESTKTPDPSKIENANMTIEEVQQSAGFRILIPTYLAGLEFYGANFNPRTNIVYLFYQEGLLIRQEAISGISDCDLCLEVRSHASFRYVQIGEIKAEYLFGVYQPKELRWQDNNLFFDITYFNDPNKLVISDLIQIAESLQ